MVVKTGLLPLASGVFYSNWTHASLYSFCELTESELTDRNI